MGGGVAGFWEDDAQSDPHPGLGAADSDRGIEFRDDCARFDWGDQVDKRTVAVGEFDGFHAGFGWSWGWLLDRPHYGSGVIAPEGEASGALVERVDMLGEGVGVQFAADEF